MSQSDRHIYEFGAFRLDANRRQLLKHGEALALSPKAVEILQVLVENRGRVVEKDELLRQVWPDSFVEEANLTVNMSALRKALGETRQHHPFITTISGRGYRFVAEVNEAAADTNQGASVDLPSILTEGDNTGLPAATRNATIDVASQSDLTIAEYAVSRPTISGSQLNPKHAARRTLYRSLIVTVALALVSVLALVLARAVFKPAPPVTAIKSIAVLPFKPITADSANESLEMGMADTLITRFSSTGRIVVRPLSAVRQYAGAQQDPVSAGRALGVDAVLEGTIQPNGARVRITVRLINSSSGLPLWAEAFDESFDDIFRVQDRVSEQVAEALALRLTSEEQKRLARHPTNNPQAYRAYIQGRYFWNKRTVAGLLKALEFFDEALKTDPAFALAYSGLSDCHVLLTVQFPPRETMEKAREAAQKALALDSSLSEAYTSLARVKQFYDWDWTGAEEDFQHAIGLDPNYQTAHHWYAQYLMDMGRQQEAVREIYRARELDPTSLVINTDIGSVLRDAGQYDQAIAVYRTVIEMDSTFARAHLELGRALSQKHLYDEAIAEIQKAIALSDRNPGMLAALGYVYAVADKREQARKLIDEIYRLQDKMYVSPYNVALVYAGLGDNDRALKLLEEAYNDRFGLMAYLKLELRFNGLRSDPRFADLLHRVGLPQSP